MIGSSLPSELVSLIHHVELSKGGWWERGTQRLVLAVLWLEHGALSAAEVATAFRTQLGITLDPMIAEAQLQKFVKAGSVIAIAGGRFKLSEQALRELDAELKAAEEITAAAKAKFESLVAASCSGLPASETWSKFNEELLVPLIREIGARTYELLSATTVDLEVSPKFSEFLGRFDAACRDPLRSAIIAFLDPTDIAVRTYVLRHLNAYFFVEAGNLPSATLTKIHKVTERPPQFALFIDTNFLFSMLGFHENPSNDAAQALMTLIRELGGRVSTKLYAYPLTLDEITRVFDWKAGMFKGAPLTPAMARAALTAGLSGVNRKLAEEIIRTGGKVTPETFFEPYRTGLVQILRAKGIEIFNTDPSKYTSRQDVIDDIIGRQKFEQSRYGDRAKTYEELRHDLTLWYIVKERRPAGIDLPLEAGSWLLTVDYKLLGFDAYKRRYSPNQMPVCVHPSALIQMLQFWVPRNAQFEEAVLGALRLPFLFQEFDPQAEMTTLKILEALVRFEDAGDLSVETATAILTNDALRAKLASDRNLKERIDLVKSALIEHAEEVSKSLKATTERAAGLEGELGKKERTITELQSDLERLRGETSEQQEQARQNQMGLERQLKAMQDALDATSAREREAKHQKLRRRERGRFAAVGLALLLATCAASLFVWVQFRSVRAVLVLFCVLLVIGVWLLNSIGQRRAEITDWVWFVRFQHVKTAVYWLLATSASAVIGEWAIKALSSSP